MNRGTKDAESHHASTRVINWNQLAAGTLGGASATALFHPLELIKIRWQVYEAASLLKKRSDDALHHHSPKYRPKYRSLLHTVSSVYQSENGIRGLYRGIGINTLASGTAWGIYFLVYNALKSRHRNMSYDGAHITVTNYTVDATIAGVFTICLTNPLFLLKTRMCLQYSRVDSAKSHVLTYRNSWHALVTLLKSEGVVGLYKGILPGIFGTLNGTIQMVTYDLMKEKWLAYKMKENSNNNDNTEYKLTTVHYSIFSSLSKILATTSTYPFQLVRARIQDQHQTYKNVFEVIGKTFRNEGFYGFYKGLLPCLIRVTPAASITFVVYENLLIFLNRINPNV